MKLTPLESKTVKAPGISESPVNIECKVVQIIPLGSHDLFLGEVTGVTVDDKYMDETGRFDLSQAKLAVYSHGEYFGLGEKIGRFGYSVAKKKTAGKKDRQAAGNQPGAKSRMTAEKQSGLKKQKTAGNRQSRQRGQNRKTTGQ